MTCLDIIHKVTIGSGNTSYITETTSNCTEEVHELWTGKGLKGDGSGITRNSIKSNMNYSAKIKFKVA
jgi:hypothetical protein